MTAGTPLEQAPPAEPTVDHAAQAEPVAAPKALPGLIVLGTDDAPACSDGICL